MYSYAINLHPRQLRYFLEDFGKIVWMEYWSNFNFSSIYDKCYVLGVIVETNKENT